MSDSDPTPPITLQVSTQDDAAEVYIIDGSFNLVASGLGRSNTFRLAPGVYSVKLRTGYQTREQLVTLSPDRPGPVYQNFEDKVPFTSPAPLLETARVHPYQIHSAQDESRKVHVQAGSGSSIFLYARDWTSSSGSQASARPPVLNPAEGLTLRSQARDVLVDFSSLSAANPPLAAFEDPWRACNLELDPGAYRLCLELPTGDRLETGVIAAPGWQTQVFVLQTDYGASPGEICRADLENAAMFMSRSGFDASDELLRLAELARLGLGKSRPVFSSDLFDRLVEKFDHPMLGIFGLHLMLRNPSFDRPLAVRVMSNLRGLLGLHPDVEALALALNLGDPGYTFSSPPTLRESWNLVLNASASASELVPARSLAGRVAGRLWGEGPWLTWLTPSRVNARVLNDQRRRALRRDITAQLERLRSETTDSETGTAEAASAQASGSSADAAQPIEPAKSTQLDDQTAEQLVNTLRLPRSRIEQLLKTTRDKNLPD